MESLSPPAPRKPGYGRFMESARSTTSAIPGSTPAISSSPSSGAAFARSLGRYGFAALQSKSILEVGCGTGQWLRDFVKWGARPDKLAGIDLLADRLSTAQQLCPQGVRIQCANAAQLPFADNVFDLVFQSTVFTSILDSELRHRVAAEMMRVLKRDGVIVWYDYHLNNPWNQDVRGVKRREIYKLFSDCTVDLKRITLLPAVARTLAPYSYFSCYLLEKVPLLCSHYLGVIRKN